MNGYDKGSEYPRTEMVTFLSYKLVMLTSPDYFRMARIVRLRQTRVHHGTHHSVCADADVHCCLKVAHQQRLREQTVCIWRYMYTQEL